MIIIDVLGIKYNIILKTYQEETCFEKRDIGAYCDCHAKEIIACNPRTMPGYEKEEDKTIIPYFKNTIRHEIVHAFLFESGLAQNADKSECWPLNEEMIDWIAWQGPKLNDTWEESYKILNELI